MRLPTFLAGELVYRGLWVLVAFACLAAGLALSRQRAEIPPLGDYGSYRCTTTVSTGNSSAEIFRILTVTSDDAVAFADTLCKLPIIKAHFAAVEIYWRSRQFLSSHHIVEERYDYFWSRSHLVVGLVPNSDDYYTPLLETPHYSLYWLATTPGLALTAAFFADKKLGLLKDNHSQSYYQQPMSALKEAGIALEDKQKIYFADISALYSALREGRIDVATGGFAMSETLGIPGLQTLLLADDVPSGFWYLRKRWFGSGIECALLKLDPSASHFNSPSRPASMMPSCDVAP